MSFEFSIRHDTALVALIMAVPVAPRLSLYFPRYPMPKSTCLMAKSTCTRTMDVYTFTVCYDTATMLP